MQRIVLASGNAGKLREMRTLLDTLDVEIVAQNEFGFPEAEETGLSFVENAILKARHAAAQTGLAAIADDSGLEVDALHGSPGIYSSRYAGPDASDQDNLSQLLHDLRDVPDTERSARFQCVIVYMRQALDPTPLICQGTWHGSILREARGLNGFGYDPVFWVPQQQCTSAELPPELKNRLSHRGQALQQLVSVLKTSTGH